MGNGELLTRKEYDRNSEGSSKQDLKLTAAVLGPVELCEGLPSISTRFAGEWDFCPCLGEGI